MAKSNSIYPPVVRVLRNVFPLLEAIAPPLASKLAIRMFLTPVRFGFSDEEEEVLNTYEHHTLIIAQKMVVYYSKGSGPEIVLLHGWSGRGMQFRVLAEELVKSGYRCLIIDAPGHGKSEGGRTNLFEFSETFNKVLLKTNDPLAVIGHSLGAASISFSVAQGTTIPAFISMGAPVMGQDILDTFTNTMNASKRVQLAIRQQAIQYFNLTFDEATMQSTFAKVTCPVFAIHGEEDKDVSTAHLATLKSIKPEIKASTYEGIGHRRILKDARVIGDIKEWLNSLKD